jgi:hypothetical protein
MFRASELAQSVYGLTESAPSRKVLRKVNTGAKIASIIVPLIFIFAIQVPHIQHRDSDGNVQLIAGVPCKYSSYAPPKTVRPTWVV